MIEERRTSRDYRLAPTAALPDHSAVVKLVEEAHERLIRSGVRPYNSRAQQEQAIKLIERFVLFFGPKFFPYVQQTEYRLERGLRTATHRDYILTGVVDILSGAVSDALGLPFSTRPDDVEIWDYKSGRMPKKGSRELQDYEYQMWVYAELYRQQAGDYPARSVLVFVGELGDNAESEAAQRDPNRHKQLIVRSVYAVYPNARYLERAIADFHRTVEDIEAERAKPYALQWEAPPTEYIVDEATCEACELRYSCTYCAGKYPHISNEKAKPL